MSARPPRYGGAPSLKPDDLGGKKVAILTMNAVKDQNFARGNEFPEYKVVVKFEGFDDKQYVLNRTGYRRLETVYGEDIATWVGKEVVLYVAKTENPQTGDQVEVVWVADEALWEKAMGKTPAKAAKRKR